eukprot:COSAG05_NODE_177_length_14916_cov_8.104002_5_plen_64_part_00
MNHKWHTRLCKMFCTGLEADYTQIRNSLIMLRAIVGQFPAVKKQYLPACPPHPTEPRWATRNP